MKEPTEYEDKERLSKLQKTWVERIKNARYKEWERKAHKVVQRYRDDRGNYDGDVKKMNILWSNTETLKPALYASTPEPNVARKFKDKNELGRRVAEILERALEYTTDNYDFDGVMKNSVEDYLLPGRGIAKVSYKPYFSEEVLNEEDRYEEDENGEQVEREGFEPLYDVAYEEATCNHYCHDDFRHSPARKWEEVTWVAFANHMTRKAGKERFGDDFEHAQFGDENDDQTEMTSNKPKMPDTATVWEVWDKTSGKVLWITEGTDYPLDMDEPPVAFEGFFPCPAPLMSVSTNNTMEPIPEFCMYQDQADEIDELTQRIHLLTRALKVAGVYDASHHELQRLVDEGSENQLVPVDTWGALAEKGGLKGVIDWMPIEQIIMVVMKLHEARAAAKGEMYEVTGISDIIRGAGQGPIKSATERRIEGQFATLRLSDRQKEVARYASDLMKLKAEVIAEKFDPQTLSLITNQEVTEQDMQLLRSDFARGFTVTIGTDSTLMPDEQAEKETRMEFLNASASFIERLAPMAMQSPAMAKLAGSMLMFGVRGFKAGRELEQEFEDMLDMLAEQANQPPAPPPPDPRVIALQQKAQVDQGNLQLKQRQQMLKEQEAQVATMEKYRQDQRDQEAHEIQMVQAIASMTPEEEALAAEMASMSDDDLMRVVLGG